MTTGTTGMSNVWDWDFFWGSFGFFLQLIASFVMIIVAIAAVGMLVKSIVSAVRQRG